MDALAAIRFVTGAAFLLFAASSDLRTRSVRDYTWIALGSIGLVLLVVEWAIDPTDLDSLALLGSAAILFSAVFFGRPLLGEEGFRLRASRLGLLLLAAVLFLAPAVSRLGGGQDLPRRTLELYPMPAMVIVYQAMYQARLLHGGADAKALIALTLLLPTYPDASPFPLLSAGPSVEGIFRIVFPFSLIIWINAAVLSLAVPVVLLARNAVRRDLAFPQAFLGYRAPVDPPPRHAWLMEKINDRGEHILVLFPKRGGDLTHDLDRLRERGIERVWVTPKLPFVLPLLGGFVLAFFLGNVLLAALPLAA